MEQMKANLFCLNCKKSLASLTNILSCKGGCVLFCSKICHDSLIKSHNKTCPGYKKQKTFDTPRAHDKISGLGFSQASDNSAPPPDSVSARIATPVSDTVSAPVAHSISASVSAPVPVPAFASMPGPSSQTVIDLLVHQQDQPHLAVVLLSEKAGPGPITAQTTEERTVKAVERSRNLHGRFESEKKDEVLDMDMVRSDEQKLKDQKCSKVTKWKAAIVQIMIKIDKEMEHAYQVYTLDSNVSRGSKECVVYRSDGNRRRGSEFHKQPSTNTLTSSLAGPDLEMQTFPEERNHDPQSLPTRQRLSSCSCFICYEKLGSNPAARIVCAIKDCFFGSAHLACLNFVVPREQLPLFRKCYYCRTHRVRRQKNGSNGPAGVSEENSDVETEENSNPRLLVRGKKKNSNITVPKRLSDQLMNVLGTDQKFLTYNDIRKLLTKYKMEKKLKTDALKNTIPDPDLALLLGPQPFKITGAVGLLKKTGALTD